MQLLLLLLLLMWNLQSSKVLLSLMRLGMQQGEPGTTPEASSSAHMSRLNHPGMSR